MKKTQLISYLFTVLLSYSCGKRLNSDASTLKMGSSESNTKVTESNYANECWPFSNIIQMHDPFVSELLEIS